MNKLIVGLIAGAFASTAFAQAAMQTPADKAKQAEVQSITKQAAEGADVSAQKAGAAANVDKTQKGTPKALTTTKEKQAAVQGTTVPGSTSTAATQAAGAAAAKDKAQKGDPKALTTTKEKQQAVSATTKAGAEGGDVNAMKAGAQADKDKAAAAAAKAAADKPKQ
jgi:colicin import membrane protein